MSVVMPYQSGGRDPCRLLKLRSSSMMSEEPGVQMTPSQVVVGLHGSVPSCHWERDAGQGTERVFWRSRRATDP